jgi:hypothetical protein
VREGYQVEMELWDSSGGQRSLKDQLAVGPWEVVPFQEIRPQIEAAASQGEGG